MFIRIIFIALLLGVSATTRAEDFCPLSDAEGQAAIIAFRNAKFEVAIAYFTKQRDCLLQSAERDRKLAAKSAWAVGSIEMLLFNYGKAEMHFLQASALDPNNLKYWDELAAVRKKLEEEK